MLLNKNQKIYCEIFKTYFQIDDCHWKYTIIFSNLIRDWAFADFQLCGVYSRFLMLSTARGSGTGPVIVGPAKV